MLQKRLLGALSAALLLVAPATAAEQSSYVAPVSGPMSMSTFAGTYLNPGLRALASCSWGSSAPANGPSGAPLPYQCWADTTSAPVLFKYYDGASWVTYGSLDTSTHTWTPYLTGGTSGGVPYFSSAGVMATSAALAQYGFLVGGGAGAAPASIAACTDDQIAFGRTSNSPLCRTVTGDITFSSGAASIGIGTNVQAYDSDLAALAANSTNGLWARTGGGAGAARTITAPAAGITVSNGSGASGNPTLALANDLSALEGLSGTGIARRTGTDTWSVGTPVANSELAAQAAYTLKMNATGSSATPTDVEISTLTTKASPGSGDYVILSDQAASGAIKKASVSSLASAGSVASIDSLTGAFTTDDSLSSSSNVLRAQFRGHLYGLTLSNNGTDATNDIDIEAGEAADADGNLMVLSSGLTKRLDAGWFPGSGNGGMETGGSIADGTWHVWLIQRSDTGATEVMFSASATSPTMPSADWDRKRWIGAIIRASGAILGFRQQGDMIKLVSPVADRNSTSSASSILLSLTVPSGIRVVPLLGFAQQQGTAGDVFQQIGDGDGSSVTTLVARTSVANERETSFNNTTITNTSGQIRYSLSVGSGSAAAASVTTFGWINERGR